MNAPGSFSRRRFLATLGLSGAGALTGRQATAKTVEPDVVSQREGEGSCGPCALANALLHGEPAARRAFLALPGGTPAGRVDAFIRQYGSRPSETYGGRRARFVTGAGLTCEDLPFLANDFLTAAGLPEVRGDWLDQAPREDESSHLRRVHALLAAGLARGLPPIIEVRSFAADTSAAATPAWVNLYAHWLALVGLEPMELPAGSSGFFCRFADSVTGRVIPGFASAERFRPFMATRGFTLRANGDKDWHWLTGHPYILLDLPDLPLAVQTRPWNNRALVACTYLVHRAA